MISVQVDTTSVRAKIEGLRFTSKGLMKNLAMLQIGLIKKRTNEGLDYKGKKFKKYSPTGGRSGTVTLRETGKMLDDIYVVSATKKMSKIDFKTKLSKAKATGHHLGQGGLPKRVFFKIGKGDDAVLSAYAETWQMKIMQEIGLAKTQQKPPTNVDDLIKKAMKISTSLRGGGGRKSMTRNRATRVKVRARGVHGASTERRFRRTKF